MRKDKYPVRTGVIGTGKMGSHHVRILHDISNLVGVYDVNSDSATKISKKYSIENFNSLDELLSQVEAVVVAVPTIYHRDIAIKAIKSKVNVLIEKPIAENKQIASEIISLSEKENVILAVGHVERHNPVISYVKSEIDRGSWGSIISISTRRLSSYPERISDVGVILDLGVHDFDIINYLVSSSFENLFSVSYQKPLKTNEDNVSVIIEYKNGIIASSELSWRSTCKLRELNMVCESSYISLDYLNQKLTITDLEGKINHVSLKKIEPLKAELLDFMQSVNEGREPLVTGREALAVIEMAEKAVQNLKK